MEEKQNTFNVLNAIDVSHDVKKKKNLSYLPWAAAWKEVKKRYPDATFKVYPQVMDEFGNKRFWHDDGKSGWVEVGVTVNGEELIETLAVMDYRNAAIPADKITSTDANKSMKRCLVKACALHGIGLYLYLGEDMPEEVSKSNELREKVKEIVNRKVKLSDKAKNKVAELCKAAEKEANPELEDDLITGNYNNIDDSEILEKLRKQLLAVRK